MNVPIKVIFLLYIILLCACYSVKNRLKQTNIADSYHSPYDDSTLNRNILPLLMPYNRVLDPAGKVISFGDPQSENHSLDVKLIPGTKTVVVEDRYGIVLINTIDNTIIKRWTYNEDPALKGLMSTYSGIQVFNENDVTHILWSAATESSNRSYVMRATWDRQKISIIDTLPFKAVAPAPLALPNEILINTENGNKMLYVVLNGNNQLVKTNLDSKKVVFTSNVGVAPYGLSIVDNKVFISNWGGPMPNGATGKETAGVPYGNAYINSKTGATSEGSVTVLNKENGQIIKEITVGLHPNDIIKSHDNEFVYVANGNSDNISAINAKSLEVVETISVKLQEAGESDLGDSPNALALSADGSILYVANGLDNAIAVVQLGAKSSGNAKGKTLIAGFIPTEAYPGGLEIVDDKIVVTNIEGEGSRVNSRDINNSSGDKAEAEGGSYNSHKQRATVSIIPLPDDALLEQYTQKVKVLNLTFRVELSRLKPRKNIAPKPMPDRIGEPSVFKHVIYIIKENRTYDQVFGDMPEGKGMKSLCIFGEKVTPNQHKLAREFSLMDNYYVSGKSSADGHQWADAGMVTDYIEKNVGGWFRSYPHVQYDALVYDANGFIWSQALKYGKTVKIYGEACNVKYDKKDWLTLYRAYQKGETLEFQNTSTISSVRPILSQNFPAGADETISDQYRADAFIKELKEYENMPGDQLPNLMVMSLGNDHTVGTRPGYPTPNAMMADNDLALGKIVEALTKSRFWESTAIFVTEDDSQNGWDHVSAYRTTGLVISPYSRLKQTIHTNYNQTSMLRSMEQILGIPPMNIIDGTALPMFDCFTDKPSLLEYKYVPTNIPLDEMNESKASLKGKALHYANMSSKPEFDLIDRGDDDLMNRILWFYGKGNVPYPWRLVGKDNDD